MALEPVRAARALACCALVHPPPPCACCARTADARLVRLRRPWNGSGCNAWYKAWMAPCCLLMLVFVFCVGVIMWGVQTWVLLCLCSVDCFIFLASRLRPRAIGLRDKRAHARRTVHCASVPCRVRHRPARPARASRPRPHGGAACILPTPQDPCAPYLCNIREMI